MKKVLVTILLSTILLLSRLAAGQAAPGSLDDQLLSAARNGDMAAVQQLLQQGVNIEAKDNKYGDTVLIKAAENGHIDIVKLLLDKGADIEARNNEGETALIEAAFEDKVDVVKLLLEKGANLEAKSNGGMTALMEAAQWGKLDVTNLLLDKGAGTETKATTTPYAGMTALMLAAGEGRIAVVKSLLEKGANIEVIDNRGSTALINAAYDGNHDLVKLLLDRGANIEAKNRDGETALLAAVTRRDEGDFDSVRLLIDKGANIEVKDTDENTALNLAARESNVDIVKLLLDKGANIEAKNHSGSTALWSATYRRNQYEGWIKQVPSESNKKGLSDSTQIVQLLQQTISRNPETVFVQAMNDLQFQPNDEARRDKVIKLVLGLPALPAIPDEARQLALQASALMKQSSTPKEMEQPIWLLRKALAIAPWWGNAYYNLSRALELSGQYDDAAKQLSYYLELIPSAADANEVRNHIAVIQAEKEAAAQKNQENESVLAVKYVAGGSTRLRYRDAPVWWRHSGGIDDLYTYAVPEDATFYINVFRMPNSHFLSISLIAQSNNGAYAGDRIGVYDITDHSCTEGNDFAFGAQDYTTPCGGRYYVSISNQPNATVTITYPATGASVTLPVALLYRGRALKGTGIFGGCSGTVHQGGARAMVLHFDCSVVKAAEDPTVNAAGLTPTTVKPE
jgi:ankyrin repeat protein